MQWERTQCVGKIPTALGKDSLHEGRAPASESEMTDEESSGFPHVEPERSLLIARRRDCRQVDPPYMAFVTCYVLLQGEQQPFCMFGGEDDAAFHFRFCQTGHHGCEIQYEFGCGMGDDGQVRIVALCGRFVELDIEVVLFVCHSRKV